MQEASGSSTTPTAARTISCILGSPLYDTNNCLSELASPLYGIATPCLCDRDELVAKSSVYEIT